MAEKFQRENLYASTLLAFLVSPFRRMGADDALRWTLSPKEEQAELAYFRAQLEKALAALNAHAWTTGVAEKADGPDPKGPDVDWAQVTTKRLLGGEN